MDKEVVKLSIKRVFTDRPFLFLVVGLLVAGLVYCLLVGFTIHPSDVTVYSRYTAFGEAHFYKAHWQYLLTFIGFGLVVTAAHLALMVKFHNLDRRQTAVLIGWAGIVLLVVGALYALAVMQLGRTV
ncbi:MAG: hypothetical protein WAQ25_00795 [Candidatus Saccharimonas sp.]